MKKKKSGELYEKSETEIEIEYLADILVDIFLHQECVDSNHELYQCKKCKD